jgi:hypothetical protein
MSWGIPHFGIGTFIGAKVFGALFGQDFGQAYMINKMTGQGGFFKTLFSDGLRSMFLGSRTNSAMLGAMNPMMYGRFPLGASIYGGPMAFNPYMMNPMAMGGMPYPMMGFGRPFWPPF